MSSTEHSPDAIREARHDDESVRAIPHKFLAGKLFWYVTVCHVVPLIGSVIAVGMLPWFQPGIVTLVTTVAFWALTLGVGISVGYHRLFSHRAFEAPTPIRVMIAVCGSMAGQGPLIGWVALHRCHHQYSDVPGDPHSPWLHGASFWRRIRGLWHAHFGWVLIYDMPDPLRYCPDLIKDRAVSRTSNLFLMWFLAGLFGPALITGSATGTAEGGLMGFLWAGCFRVAVSSQITWCINSICHVFGKHVNDTGDHSTNVAWLSIPSFGESWHNNHHAYPGSAAFGHTWYQIDLGYLVIRTLEAVGLATDLQMPRQRGADS